MLTRRKAFAAVLTLSLSGCATLPVPLGRRSGSPLSPDLAAHYDYPKLSLQAHVESTREGSGYRIQRLMLTSPDPAATHPIKVEWYKPSRAGRLPVILMSPILAGNDLYVREFARFFAGRGLHAVLVYRQKEVFSADRDLKDIENHFQESVIQLRQTLDWLQTQESVDSERIGTFAISLGAILTAILAAVEPRVKCSVLGLPAGHIAEIIMTSEDKAIRKRRRAYLERHGWTKERALKELEAVILSEPMRFAPSINPQNALVIAGIFDRVLGFHRSLDLWRSMGRPKLVLLPTGHYTAYLATPYLKIVTYSFLRRHLDRSS